MPELTRARELAFDVGLPTGSIAKMLRYEFGTDRSGDSVRDALRHHFGWRGKLRGQPLERQLP